MTDPGRSGGEGTGWHMFKPRPDYEPFLIHHPVGQCDDRCAPVIVLDPVTARDTIARALDRAEDEWDDLIEHGYAYSQGRTREDFFAEQILAALVREAGR